MEEVRRHNRYPSRSQLHIVISGSKYLIQTILDCMNCAHTNYNKKPEQPSDNLNSTCGHGGLFNTLCYKIHYPLKDTKQSLFTPKTSILAIMLYKWTTPFARQLLDCVCNLLSYFNFFLHFCILAYFLGFLPPCILTYFLDSILPLVRSFSYVGSKYKLGADKGMCI